MPRWIHTVAAGAGHEITERANGLQIADGICRFSLFAPWCDDFAPPEVAEGSTLRIGERVTLKWQGTIDRVEPDGPVFRVHAIGGHVDDPDILAPLDQVGTDG